MRDKVLVGIITGAHGIKGEVKLRSFTADPQAIENYSPLETQSGRSIEIAKLRAQRDGFIATLKGITDRNGAEALAGTELFIDRSRLPQPAEDEVYVHDLIGLKIVLKDGSHLGEVANVVNYGAGDLLEIKVEGQKDTHLIPFALRYVAEKDFAAGKLVVDLPEDFFEA